MRLVDYWATLGGPDRTPRKSVFDPGRVRPILPQLVIYERRAADSFVIRLMGTGVVERLGVELTGQDLMDVIAYAQKEQAAREFNEILDHQVGQYLLVKDRFTSGREAMVEIVRLPLLDDRDAARFIISSTRQIKVTGDGYPGEKPSLIAERLDSWYFAPEG